MAPNEPNPSPLEPLYAPWEEPTRHRGRENDVAFVRPGRRPSVLPIPQNLRAAVKEWRESFYVGASETSHRLLDHWFGRSHLVQSGDTPVEFRYYFCQREAIETLIYLREIRRIDRLTRLVDEFGGPAAELQALGIDPAADAWPKYAFKMATGSGKTKVMSLAMVWSYFHAIRESDSPMARHFLIIAPGLTVFERLKVDFKPEGGGPDIFDTDPLIPVEWRGDWNLTTVLQDEAGGTATGGVLYLTNIDRLYVSRGRTSDPDTYEWMGPPVSRARALDTAAALRDRISAHPKLLVINDEAHHVWDPDSAWSESIATLNTELRQRTGVGLAAQLDFSATPKDNNAAYFQHIICDSPLGEAVDAGIVKTPILGDAGTLPQEASDDAAYKYGPHLQVGYQRWLRSREEWLPSGKKPLLFVMCEDTTAANQIAHRLNTDDLFKELHGKTINLHTRLKGRIKTVGRGANARKVFDVSEKDIKPDDLRELRKLSRELDSGQSPYLCIVSVLMLREGWDVRNITTIVPLRPYSSKAQILPEQTLGRGLRRMTPPGGPQETVTFVDHPAFNKLYRDELALEGLDLQIIDADKIPATTVSVFPDAANKDLRALDIHIPRLRAGTQTLPVLGPIAEDEVRRSFSYDPLPLGASTSREIEYEGRHLFTNEVVERMKFEIPLLSVAFGAISYYIKAIEYTCKVRGTHQVLAPLLETFFERILFSERVSLSDPTVIARLSNDDVRAHVHATFIPLVRSKITQTQPREPESAPGSLATWRPYAATFSQTHPVVPAAKTLFNLAPCSGGLEPDFVPFCDNAPDVAAFAKNAGPQAMRIDYLGDGNRIGSYTPDFFVRLSDGRHLLAETKGRVDADVPAKARAAVEWCRAATTDEVRWEYLYIPESTFRAFGGNTIAELARTCAPTLADLIKTATPQQDLPGFAGGSTPAIAASKPIVSDSILAALPAGIRSAVDQAMDLFDYLDRKQDTRFAPVFAALFGATDELARMLIVDSLQPAMPAPADLQSDWFTPRYPPQTARPRSNYDEIAKNLRRTLAFGNGRSPLGLLRNCLDYALNDNTKIDGVFAAMKQRLRFAGGRDLLALVGLINDTRNTFAAHQSQQFESADLAREALRAWVELLAGLQSHLARLRHPPT